MITTADQLGLAFAGQHEPIATGILNRWSRPAPVAVQPGDDWRSLVLGIEDQPGVIMPSSSGLLAAFDHLAGRY
jgi:hypothetical protein